MNTLKLRQQLHSFLVEDIGDQDLTSYSIFPADQMGSAVLTVKETGIIAGLEMIQETYQLLDPSIHTKLHCADGDFVTHGDIIAEIMGPVVHLLTGERVILNLLQRMSGIATMTNQCIQALNNASINICDTRKTTPGLRMFEKYAVIVGGGKNHRKGLYDGVMIKDNHISFSGSITKAVQAAREHVGHMVKIEVETEAVAQVKEAVTAGADIIMFDNQIPSAVNKLATYVPNHIITEASGGITLETIGSYANTNVDYISLGFLTHSVQSLDISAHVNVS